jgi:hypothetical protein
LGSDFQTLNSTVEGPYSKKRSDTQATLLHLSDSVCSENEDALNEFILSSDGRISGGEDAPETKLNPTDSNINQCKDFFDQINQALLADNYQIATLMKSMERKLEGLFTDTATREKIFLVVVNTIKPLAACHQPMQELKMRLIKKYLKRFLMDQISPIAPSFSGKTLPVVSHPELFITYQKAIKSRAKAENFDWNQKRVRGSTVAPKRVIKVQTQVDSTLTDSQKLRIIGMDARNADKTLEQRDTELRQAVATGKVTDTAFLSMTPQQKLNARLISPTQFRQQVSVPEDHGHFTAPIEIDNLWDPALQFKGKKIPDDMYDRYKIKGFDIDTKIEQLFHR